MKYLKIAGCLAASLFFIATTNAQIIRQVLDEVKPAKKFDGVPVLKKRSQVFYAGVGAQNNVATLINFTDFISGLFGAFGASSTTYGKAGPFIAGYEYFIKDDISIGINLGYAKAGKKFVSSFANYDATLTAYTIAVSGSYHLYTTDKLDPYIKGAVGVNLWTSKATGIKIPIPTPVSYNGLLGIRYFASPHWAPFGELGYSSLKFSANIGAAYKLK